ncbi:MAG TPA: VOC family protein [Caulobacteraceae bacterium]|nr:VOC family protein [Caulobacteraceae bacterium]
MHTNIYLYFSGNLEQAFEYYRDHLGGEILMLSRYKDIPMPAEHKPQGWDDKVMHGRIKLGDAIIMGSDVKREQERPMQAFDLVANTDTAEEAERVFKALADGGAVSMPLTETFFAVRYGSLKDRFGVPWSVSCEKPMQ